jgi:5'(3')-deoxyribonucleotidase
MFSNDKGKNLVKHLSFLVITPSMHHREVNKEIEQHLSYFSPFLNFILLVVDENNKTIRISIKFSIELLSTTGKVVAGCLVVQLYL